MITEDHRKELDALLAKCLEHDDKLSEWEQSFVNDFVERLEKWGEKLNVSDKQQCVFDRIAAKLEKEGL